MIFSVAFLQRISLANTIAKAIRLEMPPGLFVLADVMIEEVSSPNVRKGSWSCKNVSAEV